MYLSCLSLNPRSRRVRQELADPYQMHRSLMRAFPDHLQEGEERVLFRVDADPRSGALSLLVQSLNRPDWGWLDEPGARGYLLAPPQSKPFSLTFTPGQTLAFRLRANPTVKRRFNEREHKRVGLVREDEQIDWLRRKGERGGFRLLSVQAGSPERIGGRIQREYPATQTKETHALNFVAVQFDGVLQVTDPERLWQTVCQGIGSGKGLGFGLLSLARPTA